MIGLKCQTFRVFRVNHNLVNFFGLNVLILISLGLRFIMTNLVGMTLKLLDGL